MRVDFSNTRGEAAAGGKAGKSIDLTGLFNF